MAVVVPATLSVLVSVWMETLLYGINVVIYFSCLYVFICRRARRHENNKIRRGLLVLSTLLFFSSTAHVSVNLRRLIEGYVLPPTKAAMTKYLVDITQPTDIAKQFLLVITNFLSDLIITWRVHIVWAYNWRITVIPLFLCLAVLSSGIGTAISIALAEPGQSIFIAQIMRFGIAALSMSLAMNVTATFLIASRIWWVTRRVAGQRMSLSPSSDLSLPSIRSEAFAGALVGGCLGIWKRHNGRYWHLVIILIESASSAAFIQVIGLASYVAKSPIIYFVADSTVQVVAIAPLLIIAFVGLTNDRSRGDWSTSLSYNDNGWRGVGPSHGAAYCDNAASIHIGSGIGSTSQEVGVEEGRCNVSQVSTVSEGGTDTNAGIGIADPIEMAMDSAPSVGTSHSCKK